MFFTKNIEDDANKSFLIENVYNYCNSDSSVGFVKIDAQESEQTSLDNVAKKFQSDLNLDKSKIKNDNKLHIIKPFFNRDEELNFIADKISNIIKSEPSLKDDKLKPKEFIENQILIVCAVNKEITSKHLDSIFKKTGLFIFHSIPSGLLKKDVAPNSFENIYYKVKDFINCDICYTDGSKLSVSDKTLIFEKSFNRIKIPTNVNLFSSSPILEFIFKIYDIAVNGINVRDFKVILFSNWYW